jgi:hypothetical protein
LVVAFELLHRFDLAKKNKSMSAEELDLIEFLVAQVALLSFSLVMEEACDIVVAEPHALSSVTCEVVESGMVSSFVTPAAVMDVQIAIVTEPHPLSSVACEVVEL